MPDEPKTGHQESEPDKHIAPASLGVGESQSKPTKEAPGKAESNSSHRPTLPWMERFRIASRRRWSETGLSEFKAIEQWTLAMAIIGLVVAGITLRVFKQQLGEMKTQTDQLIQQGEVENAGASHRAAETFRQLNILQEQAKAAESEVRQLQLGLRPYVGFSGKGEITCADGTVVPSGLSVNVRNCNGPQPKKPVTDAIFPRLYIVNYGKTPSVGQICIDRAIPNPPHKRLFCKEAIKVTPILWPNVETPVESRRWQFEQPEIDGIRGKTALFKVYGYILYRDEVFRCERRTDFCAVLRPDVKTFGNCENTPASQDDQGCQPPN